MNITRKGIEMKVKLILYAIGIWFILAVLGIINGTFRNLVLEPTIGKYVGHLVSTIILICIILLATFIFIKKIIIDHSRVDLVLIGATWVLFTVIFEFVFGHYVMGNSWDTLLADYNVLQGRFWSLVLVTEFFAPLAFGSTK